MSSAEEDAMMLTGMSSSSSSSSSLGLGLGLRWRAYLGHAIVGGTAYVVGKGVFLVPFQNKKTLVQVNAARGREEYREKSKRVLLRTLWSLGLPAEILSELCTLAIRLGFHTLVHRLFLLPDPSRYPWAVTGIVLPAVATTIGRTLVFPIMHYRVQLVNDVVAEGKDTAKRRTPLHRGLVVAVAFCVAQDTFARVVGPWAWQRAPAGPSWLDGLYYQRLVESAVLGVGRLLLSPLEALYKRLVVGATFSPGEESIASLYAGSLYSFPEAFSLVFLRHFTYRLLAPLFTPIKSV